MSLARGISHAEAAALPTRELLLYRRYFEQHPPDLTAKVVARYAATQVRRRDKLPVRAMDFAPECYPVEELLAHRDELAAEEERRSQVLPGFFQGGLDVLRAGGQG